jgi:hypothetical protein
LLGLILGLITTPRECEKGANRRHRPMADHCRIRALLLAFGRL